MLQRLFNGVRTRLKWAKIGVRYLRSSDFSFDQVTVRGRKIRLSVPPAERSELEYEFRQIYFNDCYCLARLQKPPNTIIDVGGNVGLFSLVARHRFPEATLHCYEPNEALIPHLGNNVGSLDVQVFPEAIGGEQGRAELSLSGSSMHATTRRAESGVPMITLDTAIARCGGKVDLLKLDCEGAEWAILETGNGLANVFEITMEFHLWAKPGSTVDHITKLLNRQGFEVLAVKKGAERLWGFIHAARDPS